MNNFLSWLVSNYVLYVILIFVLNIIVNRLIVFLIFRHKRQQLYDLTIRCEQLKYQAQKLEEKIKKDKPKNKE